MIPNSSRSTIPLPNNDGQELNQIQADLMPTARKWALKEVSAAMVHQLNEPLTALLLYLHEIKNQGAYSAEEKAIPHSMREMVEKALCETQRICAIMSRVGHTVEAPLDFRTAVVRGREAIDSWTQSNNANGGGGRSASPGFARHVLTPRELEVLSLISKGASNKEGGHRLGISTRTFEVHRAHIMEKLGAKNAADLVRIFLTEFR
jgi:DNA-binding CsgD family transcriptional regulator